MRIARTLVWLLVLAAIVTGLYLACLQRVREHPADFPWTELDLRQPIGIFTGRKIAALGDDFRQCHTQLFRAGVRYQALPPGGSNQCAYDNAVQFTGGGTRRIGYRPDRLDVACPIAAGLVTWESRIVQPAAERNFGSRVATIDHYGSYSCRRVNNSPSGDWSEHASANAVDIAAFRLADGRRISIASDWNATPEERAFLREVRDGACRLFATVLSPDYNAAHRDHLHFDQADRGDMGWRACR